MEQNTPDKAQQPVIPAEELERFEDESSEYCANRPTVSPWAAYRDGASAEYLHQQDTISALTMSYEEEKRTADMLRAKLGESQAQLERLMWDSTWIATLDSVPESGKSVLAINNLGYMKEQSWMEHTMQDEHWFRSTYTHWTELPHGPFEVRQATAPVNNSIPSIAQNPDGWHRRYVVSKANGEDADPTAQYLVLRLDDGGRDKDHIKAGRAAARTYANAISHHLPKVAEDILRAFPDPSPQPIKDEVGEREGFGDWLIRNTTGQLYYGPLKKTVAELKDIFDQSPKQ